ncbi:enterobactin ABC transporter permease [Allofranklinella schreckenbergeri]|uniref:Enterobactin ABC transporter permease n=1 Tax=Allofranklinella schreckenbergeri TaxID=1076744 RepID=A0A3M6Q7C7_9BURK|nr:iron chelate uptake ABC transporter family permease subunit [Allofranklinella schreckenbergeri]RMW99073.1 enterobactin ABC transporter permease [Allofranklinella schreckenbergeri]
MTAPPAAIQPAPAQPAPRRLGPAARLAALALCALLCAALFLTLNTRTDWAFTLQLRGAKLAAMALVAYAVGISTVLFHSITHNRILTPAIMGFDALYLLIQTALAWAFGMQALSAINPTLKFAAETALMLALALLLFRSLFTGGVRSLHLMLLVGVVLGVLFRAATALLLRLIDPNQFGSLQDRFFASFNQPATALLATASALLLAASALLWRMRHQFDVIALGRDMAINLGIDYQRRVLHILVCIALLVSVSTALVGPVTFLGLLAANLAYTLIGDMRHRYSLPAAALLGFIALAGGQMALEHALGYNSALSIVIEFIGGIAFIALLLRQGR